MGGEQPHSLALVEHRVVGAVDGVPPVHIAHVQEGVQSGFDELGVVRGRVRPHQNSLVHVEVVVLLAGNVRCKFVDVKIIREWFSVHITL